MIRIAHNKLQIQLKPLNVSLILIISYFISSCNYNKGDTITEKEPKKEVTKHTIEKKSKTIKKKVIEVYGYDVLIVKPTQKQLDSLQSIMGEDEYSTFVDNSTFYFNKAKDYCENIHSVFIEVSSGENLVFVTQRGKRFPFVTKDLFWEMIVFNGKTKPEQIDITRPQDEMQRVYNIAKNKT